MTFQIGDRVKVVDEFLNACHEGVRHGSVHVVSHVGVDWVGIDGGGYDEWRSSRFELYAKAGEFVVGDQVIVTKDGEDDAPTGAMFTVTGTGRGYEDRQTVDFTDNVGDGREWLSDRFRLATPEEIAATEPKAKTVDLHGCMSGEQAARWAKQMAEDQGGFQGIVINPAEIPAADFDFSTIKAGDEILMRRKVDRDGLTENGNISTGGWYVDPSNIHSVIPAPKPKTLRERAIEAAEKVGFDGAFVGNMSALKAAIVDLVLAEVEKGR